MYGQFHHAQSIRTERSTHAKANIFLGNEKKPKSALFVSLLLICLSVSTVSFAGSKQPRLAGGNGNAQGR